MLTANIDCLRLIIRKLTYREVLVLGQVSKPLGELCNELSLWQHYLLERGFDSSLYSSHPKLLLRRSLCAGSAQITAAGSMFFTPLPSRIAQRQDLIRLYMNLTSCFYAAVTIDGDCWLSHFMWTITPDVSYLIEDSFGVIGKNVEDVLLQPIERKATLVAILIKNRVHILQYDDKIELRESKTLDMPAKKILSWIYTHPRNHVLFVTEQGNVAYHDGEKYNIVHWSPDITVFADYYTQLCWSSSGKYINAKLLDIFLVQGRVYVRCHFIKLDWLEPIKEFDYIGYTIGLSADKTVQENAKQCFYRSTFDDAVDIRQCGYSILVLTRRGKVYCTSSTTVYENVVWMGGSSYGPLCLITK